MIKIGFVSILLIATSTLSFAQKIDYSAISVPIESGVEFLQISSDNDYVCMPLVKRSASKINWATNHILDISKNGNDIAYLSWRNNTSNIFIKSLDKQGSSIQRTNRSAVQDFSYSPDGNYICFSEKRGKTTQISQTSAEKGYVCRLITSNNSDYSPVYSRDMTQILFARQEANGYGIWSYDIKNKILSSLTSGMNPYPFNDSNTLICAIANSDGRNEIWKINYETGVEECIISDTEQSFTSPRVSPDGNWIVFVGSSKITTNKSVYWNTDIFVARVDGTDFTQLTYHAADDLSPVWSKDSKYIYFVSQRGSSNGVANIWRMSFPDL